MIFMAFLECYNIIKTPLFSAYLKTVLHLPTCTPVMSGHATNANSGTSRIFRIIFRKEVWKGLSAMCVQGMIRLHAPYGRLPCTSECHRCVSHRQGGCSACVPCALLD